MALMWAFDARENLYVASFIYKANVFKYNVNDTDLQVDFSLLMAIALFRDPRV